MRRIAAVWPLIAAAWRSRTNFTNPARLRSWAIGEHIEDWRERLHRLNDGVRSRPRVAGLSAACLLIFSMFLLLPNPQPADEQDRSIVKESELPGFEQIEFAEPVNRQPSPVGRDFVSDRVQAEPHAREMRSAVAAHEFTPFQPETWPGLPGSIQTVGFETETSSAAKGAYLIGIIEEIPDQPETP